jgi:hypothetical protein
MDHTRTRDNSTEKLIYIYDISLESIVCRGITYYGTTRKDNGVGGNTLRSSNDNIGGYVSAGSVDGIQQAKIWRYGCMVWCVWCPKPMNGWYWVIVWKDIWTYILTMPRYPSS